jgi:hypothetical protein
LAAAGLVGVGVVGVSGVADDEADEVVDQLVKTNKWRVPWLNCYSKKYYSVKNVINNS